MFSLIVTLDKLKNLKIMDDQSNIGRENDSHIDISESKDVQYWSEKLNVPEEVLKSAVRAAGTSVEDFMEHLEQNR